MLVNINNYGSLLKWTSKKMLGNFLGKKQFNYVHRVVVISSEQFERELPIALHP
jgi:hypothetical protein